VVIDSSEEEREEEVLAADEGEAAAAEAAGIGSKAARDSDDPEQPLIEAGEGEAEGFELSERDLRDIAEHGDQYRFPDNVPPPPEEKSDAEYGEPDEAIPEDE